MLCGPAFFCKKMVVRSVFVFHIWTPFSLFIPGKKKLTLPSPPLPSAKNFHRRYLLSLNTAKNIRSLAFSHQHLVFYSSPSLLSSLLSSKTAAPSVPFNFIAWCSFKITQANLVFMHLNSHFQQTDTLITTPVLVWYTTA